MRYSSAKRGIRFAWCLAALAVGGCAAWSTPQSDSASVETRLLPAPRMSPDAVGVSITMVDIPDTAEEPYADLWNEIDEQAIPVEMRRRLEANGLRCGHISGQLPQRILDQFNSSEDLSGLAEGDFRAIDTSLSARAELRQLRAGQPSKIALTKQPVGQVHVLENE
ncbi:MAG: hypothetical protein KDA71_05755, partial [Planctomycetales bacterium]|nr:hypothetical protein [Planctomycetales bacterium]